MFDIFSASQKLSQLDIRFLLENLGIEVLWFRAAAGDGEWVIKRHTHSSFEFHIIYSGACKVVLDDGEFIAQQGEFYLTGPGVFHRQEFIPGKSMIEFCINCDLKLLDRNDSEAAWLYQIFDNAPCLPLKDEHGATALFYRALSEAYSHETGYYNNIKSLLIMILYAAARAIDNGKTYDFKAPVKIKKNEYRMRQIEKFIDDNISGPIGADDIAAVLFLSSKQVGRIIGQACGMSTKEFIMRKKLERAKQLLREDELPIKEIADRLGFSSVYYFSQFFKKNEGYPPKTFRENVNSN